MFKKNLQKFGTKQCQVKRNCARGILLSQHSKCYSEYIIFSYLKACSPFFSVCLLMEFRFKIKISDLILQLHLSLLQLILAEMLCVQTFKILSLQVLFIKLTSYFTQW